jgi:hypothetical protein
MEDENTKMHGSLYILFGMVQKYKLTFLTGRNEEKNFDVLFFEKSIPTVAVPCNIYWTSRAYHLHHHSSDFDEITNFLLTDD